MPIFSVPANYAFEDYDALVEALNDWLDRSDLTGTAQQMIALAEARMQRKLAPLIEEVSADVAIADGIGSFPSDLNILSRVIYDGQWLPRMSRIEVTELSGEEPAAFTLEAGSIRIWPAFSVTVTILYQPRFLQLSEGTPTNELLSRHPDVYFYGAMLFAEGYLANDSRAAMFKQLWDESLAELEDHYARQRKSTPAVLRYKFP